jgi:hypothetical protein
VKLYEEMGRRNEYANKLVRVNQKVARKLVETTMLLERTQKALEESQQQARKRSRKERADRRNKIT